MSWFLLHHWQVTEHPNLMARSSFPPSTCCEMEAMSLTAPKGAAGAHTRQFASEVYGIVSRCSNRRPVAGNSKGKRHTSAFGLQNPPNCITTNVLNLFFAQCI